MKLPPKPRAVITGAGSGLGRALALSLARRSARVVLADVDAARTEETAELVRRAGGSASVVRCDVGSLADVEALRDAAEAAYGDVDLLVNNAGVAAGGKVGEIPIADWEWMLRINLWGVIYGCHVFVPKMRARGAGAILNVASCAGIACLPEMASYNVAKAGVIALSETLRGELAGAGIDVTVLCPSFFESRIMESFRSPEERQKRLAEAFFKTSKTTAGEVAEAALRGLERGEHLVIPQSDGTLLWRAKRLAPGLYHKVVTSRLRVYAERVLLRRS